MPPVVQIAAAGVLGLLIGSFLNVVIWRVPRGESVVTPRSHCPVCDHPIRGRDNVPVLSWLVLRGRCRDCGAAISMRYSVVEALTSLSFAVVAGVALGNWVLVALGFVVVSVLIAVAFVVVDRVARGRSR